MPTVYIPYTLFSPRVGKEGGIVNTHNAQTQTTSPAPFGCTFPPCTDGSAHHLLAFAPGLVCWCHFSSFFGQPFLPMYFCKFSGR